MFNDLQDSEPYLHAICWKETEFQIVKKIEI